MKISNGNIPIEIIDSEKKLIKIVEHLKSLKEISIDTEFDRFRYQYGIHLQLIQIFDGITCYLIDPLRINNLDILWQIFEDKNICKVIYSGSEDVDILKRFGCNLKNLFDVQIAATLCNRIETSYSKLIASEFGVEIDKKWQVSRWGVRPLTASQLIYASNDVMYLPRLKEIILTELVKKKLLHVLQNENIILESSTTEEYEPKLTGKHKKVFNTYIQGKLMEFKNLIDNYAKVLNLPPFYIVPDSILEEIVKEKSKFLENPFVKAFHKDVVEDVFFKKQFLDIVDSIDTGKGWENAGVKHFIKSDFTTNYSNKKELRDENFLPFKQYVVEKYGEVASTVMLRGLAKMFSDEEIKWQAGRKYQKDLYKEYLNFAESGGN